MPMANVDNDVTPSFRVTLSCILIVSLWLVVVLCPPINVLKLNNEQMRRKKSRQ